MHVSLKGILTSQEAGGDRNRIFFAGTTLACILISARAVLSKLYVSRLVDSLRQIQ